MRYYELDQNGRIKSHARWPFKDWVELPEHPGELYRWDGSQWVEDTERINEIEQEEQQEQESLNRAVSILMDNSGVIRQAMDGVGQARSALDSVLPIDTTTTQTIIDSLANRQAAVMFLAANSFRAAVHLSESGSLPDSIVDEFMK